MAWKSNDPTGGLPVLSAVVGKFIRTRKDF